MLHHILALRECVDQQGDKGMREDHHLGTAWFHETDDTTTTHNNNVNTIHIDIYRSSLTRFPRNIPCSKSSNE